MASRPQLGFKVGDKAVYPAHGVGVIDRIETKEISGTLFSFYILRILDSDMTIMVPTVNAEAKGLRRLIPGSKVEKVFKTFQDQNVVIDTTTWNRRYREYMEKIKTGSVFEIAEVMRDLYVLKKTKVLSFGERKMLDTARNLLVKELALAKEISEEDVERRIRKYFEE
jgi:CarD family transcriptional regulator